MKDFSHMNPASRRMSPSCRKFTRSSGAPPPIRGAGREPKANSDVVFLIWGLSLVLLFFLALVGGLSFFLWGILLVPLSATIQIGLSKMGGSEVWAWSMAGLYVAYCFLWFWIAASS